MGLCNAITLILHLPRRCTHSIHIHLIFRLPPRPSTSHPSNLCHGQSHIPTNCHCSHFNRFTSSHCCSCLLAILCASPGTAQLSWYRRLDGCHSFYILPRRWRKLDRWCVHYFIFHIPSNNMCAVTRHHAWSHRKDLGGHRSG